MVTEELKNKMIEWRHHLHQHPETAMEEYETSAFVAERLKEMGIEVVTGVGGTGVLGILKCGDGKETIALRADMDALNLPEKGDVPYKSLCEGKMHGCGHDGHTTMLLGAADILSKQKNFNGTVIFLFQPGEEPGYGAKAMIEDGLFDRFPIDEFYGIHNHSGYPFGKFSTKSGGIASSEDNFVITITGQGGHASAPQFTKDPLVIASEIILALQTIVSRNMNPQIPAVISCTEFITDGAHNAIPTTVTIKGDTRSYAPETQKLIEDRMRIICEKTCEMNGAKCDFVYTHEFAPTVNWEQCVKVAAEAAAKVVGAENVDANASAATFSEDFGLYLLNKPGCFLLLGSFEGDDVSKSIPMHNAKYDFNDNILPIGAQFFAELIATRLPK